MRKTYIPGDYISQNLLQQLLCFIDPQRRTYIGESGRFCAADFLSHPRWRQNLQLVRSRFPRARIDLSIIATGLTEEDVDFISEHTDSIDLSVHFLEAEHIRKYITADYLKDRRELPTEDIIRSFARRDIDVSLSTNPMPRLAGWSQYDEIVSIASDCGGVKRLSFSVPRFTRSAPQKIIQMTTCPTRQLRDRLARWRAHHPSLFITSPDARGPMNSAEVIYSEAEDIKVGDIIGSIDGEIPQTGTQANQLLDESGAKVVCIETADGQPRTVNLSGGEVVKLADDVDPGVAGDINCRILPHFEVLILTSIRAKHLMKKLTEQIDARHVQTAAVQNHFFGGSIDCGGLLTVGDFLRARGQISGLDDFDVAFTTTRFLGPDGRDLLGEHWIRLEEEFGLPFYFL